MERCGGSFCQPAVLSASERDRGPREQEMLTGIGASATIAGDALVHTTGDVSDAANEVRFARFQGPSLPHAGVAAGRLGCIARGRGEPAV